MSTKHHFSSQEVPQAVTLTSVEGIDLFSREAYKEILISHLKDFMIHRGLHLYAYVIMNNHLHLVAQTERGELPALIEAFKQSTSQGIYKKLQRDFPESRRNWLLWIVENQAKKSGDDRRYKVWQAEHEALDLNTHRQLLTQIDHIHRNPVRAGICYTAEAYKYSSAGIYAGEAGVLAISEVIKPGVKLP
ncbi:hypothetical protein SAMN05421823_109189 [Catalinimonas alkaloidigena]|uniref:Transposase IS200-like domain-containing protein n=1 Tax=Catalinimonas alkaloidigena TaxID=1075417 RepID=A0A1G9PHB6_9BACT|nr:hypothetical protein [Catalinimonas alkaloidigena]SDL97933.1 hypothetical protein SAMN05421823_109189 [Catalinimonas alkaloidigena]